MKFLSRSIQSVPLTKAYAVSKGSCKRGHSASNSQSGNLTSSSSNSSFQKHNGDQEPAETCFRRAPKRPLANGCSEMTHGLSITFFESSRDQVEQLGLVVCVCLAVLYSEADFLNRDNPLRIRVAPNPRLRQAVHLPHGGIQRQAAHNAGWPERKNASAFRQRHATLERGNSMQCTKQSEMRAPESLALTIRMIRQRGRRRHT